MKPHPRIRTAIKWGGAAVTVLLVVVWIGSGWWTCEWTQSNCFAVLVQRGSVGASRRDAVEYDNPSFMPKLQLWKWFRGSGGRGWEWLPWHNDFFDAESVMIPLWIPAFVAFIGTVSAWRLDTRARRRARLNLCRKCHYDRTGLAASAKCPECGAASG